MEGRFRLYHQGEKFSELGITLAVTSSMHQLLVTANVVPSSLILVALMMETIHSSKTSILTKV
jgi:hypothetical protein